MSQFKNDFGFHCNIFLLKTYHTLLRLYKEKKFFRKLETIKKLQYFATTRNILVSYKKKCHASIDLTDNVTATLFYSWRSSEVFHKINSFKV